jgi:hypothetical protein
MIAGTCSMNEGDVVYDLGSGNTQAIFTTQQGEIIHGYKSEKTH